MSPLRVPYLRPYPPFPPPPGAVPPLASPRPLQLFEIFHGVLRTDPEVRCAALSDIAACRERDPACTSYSHALLYYKGYHAVQTQRIAHALWRRNQKVMALAMQVRTPAP